MALWQGVGYHEPIALPDNETLELLAAGHILGSAMVRLSRSGKHLVFTGDLGGGNSPLLPPTEKVSDATYLVMEGTYGDRVRPDDAQRRDRLENIIEDTVARGGTLLIPPFSTERTQDLIYEIRTLMVERRVPSMPVFIDSPLASKITAAFVANPEYFAPEMRKRIEGGEHLFAFDEAKFIENTQASLDIHKIEGPKIILAGSGMSSGGRIFSHEREYLPDERSTILIVGYQAAGTIGRKLVEGAKSLELYAPAAPHGRKAGHGGMERVPVRARVETLYGYSAHRDSESLLQFANDTADTAKEIFVVHAEPASAAFLSQRIRDYLGVKATVPAKGDKVTLQL